MPRRDFLTSGGAAGVLAMSRHGRIDDSQVGEPAAHKAPVAGDERIGALQRMCADEEVRDDGKPQSLFLSCRFKPRFLPDFPGTDRRGFRHRREVDAERGHLSSERRLVRKTGGRLRPYHVTRDEGIKGRKRIEEVYVGLGIDRVVEEYVIDDVRVDGVDHQHPLISRISSSVLMPPNAPFRMPLASSNGLRFFFWADTMRVLPLILNVRTMPGAKPSRVRNCLGIVTCPRSQSVAVVIRNSQ